jgi:pyrimidine oxygenase
MDDCSCLPLPAAKITIISAGQSEAGTRFAVEHADHNFRSGGGINQPTRVAESVGRLVTANEAAGTQCGALVLTMIIADGTDAAAMAKWEHYKTRTDHEAIAWRDSQFADDPTSDPLAGPNKRCTLGTQGLPTQVSVLFGSYASVASMLDELASVPDVQGMMLTFDDFISGIERFGRRIQPLMRSRAELNLAV